jgi:hypothetical protein
MIHGQRCKGREVVMVRDAASRAEPLLRGNPEVNANVTLHSRTIFGAKRDRIQIEA